MDDKYLESHENESLLNFWHVFLNNIYFIIITIVTFFLITFIYAWFLISPKYISNADVMIQVEQDNSSSTNSNYDLVNAFRLIDTVAELMEKDIILENAVKKLDDLGYQNIDIKYLREGLIIRSSSSSYFINISFVDENTILSKDIVDSIIDAVIEETDVADAFPVLTDKIRRTSYSSEPEYYSPNKFLYLFGGVFLGAVISIGFVFTKEILSTHFRSKEEIEKSLNLQVLGIIPLMDSRELNHGKKK